MEYWPSTGPAHRDFHRNNYPFLAARYSYLGSNWIDLTNHSTRCWPQFPACYVIQEDGVTVYVGQTTNLAARMRQHRCGLLREIKNPRIKVRFGFRFGDWAMRELRLIRRLRPRYNVQGCRHDR